MLSFAIIEFKQSRSVSVIPSSWFCGEEEDKCYWPSRISDTMRITKMVSKQCDPDTTWPVFNIRVLGKAGDYSRARQKAILAEDTSNIDTDTEDRPRKKRRNHRYLSSDEESSDSEPVANPTTPLHHPVPTAPSSLLALSTSLASTSRQKNSSTASCSRPRGSDSHASSPTPSLDRATPTRGNSHQRVREQPRSASEADEAAPLNSAGLRKVLSVLEGMRQTQLINTANIQLLIRQSEGSVPVAEFTMPDGISLPVETEEEFKAFNEQLQDDAFRKGLVIFLGDTGGRNLEETVKRIMGRLFSDDFATGCNISGRNKKTGIGKTALFDVICRAVKRNRTTCHSTRKDVETAAAKWLIGSRDRCGARRERLARAEPAELTVPDTEETDDDE